MSHDLKSDLQKLADRAFDRADWAEACLRRYHAASARFGAARLQPLRGLYEWMFVPIILWPFNLQDVLAAGLTVMEKGKRLNARHRLIIDLLPPPPEATVCAAVADHEWHLQQGNYEAQINTRAKYDQNELAIKSDAELRRQWAAIKAAFRVQAWQDHKGVIRRSMSVERNLRLPFTVNLRRQNEAFHAVFDAFCLRWHLYGMRHDEPLLLKLAVHLTPYGTMIHIPAYWSFDPKRDLRWDAIARLHRARVPGRQGPALAQGVAQRMKLAEKLRRLDSEVKTVGLSGKRKHEFLCAGLGWDPRTDPKRLNRLRAEFK